VCVPIWCSESGISMVNSVDFPISPSCRTRRRLSLQRISGKGSGAGSIYREFPLQEGHRVGVAEYADDAAAVLKNRSGTPKASSH
jgi:hypothetical protein